ncbi:23S rRNA (adenine(2503)-C(2))-methyltransferase RlmN [Anaerolineales bacterium HSG25]|nr:23S rRNA (adenine(2503)-C(2))-methyltransferase RlmN [Anaerolineales bacterium HSG25]
MINKASIFDLTTIEIEQFLAEWGQPTYRAKQIETWLYQNYADSASVMTNLPKSLRQKLAQNYLFEVVTPHVVVDSTDGFTRKSLFKLTDGREIEAVLMRYEKRQTLCISTQIGCAMGCPFCATGQMGFMRNLTAGEIVAQVLHYARQLSQEKRHVTNIVFMGMGEPLANYAQTWQAIRRLNDSSGFNLGARHMTVSTVGLVPAIRRMSKEPEQIGLAVSLHAPTDELRDTLIPINKRYPIAMLMDALRDYIATTKRRITFEYALMDNLNDSDEQADQLADLVKDMLCHINLIPLNPTPDSPWSGSPDERVYKFRDRLQTAGVPTTVRVRRGIDIAAGCGQLHNAHANRVVAK